MRPKFSLCACGTHRFVASAPSLVVRRRSPRRVLRLPRWWPLASRTVWVHASSTWARTRSQRVPIAGTCRQRCGLGRRGQSSRAHRVFWQVGRSGMGAAHPRTPAAARTVYGPAAAPAPAHLIFTLLPPVGGGVFQSSIASAKWSRINSDQHVPVGVLSVPLVACVVILRRA